MKATAEVSLYPLKDEYESCIIDFIQSLKGNPELEIYTHSMSSFIKGDHDAILKAISQALKDIESSADTVSLVVKFINRELPVEKGFIKFS